MKSYPLSEIKENRVNNKKREITNINKGFSKLIS